MTSSYVLNSRPATPVNEHRVQTSAALLVMVAIPALCIAGNHAGLLRLVFPALSVLVGAFLLWRSKPAYVGLVCWLWFLTPFLRRMADFQGGGSTGSAVLLAPYLTAGLSGITFLSSLGSLQDRRYLPYVSPLFAVAYGLIIGIARYSLFDVLQALLNWIVPIIFGMFLFKNQRFYREFGRVIERSFLYGVLLTGLYGIYQFFSLPDWDKAWMLSVKLNSFGAVEPMKIRVFSTMNAPVIFGAAMACGLLILFNTTGKLRFVSIPVGFVGLLLTMSRSAWLTLAAGAGFLLIRMEMRQRARVVMGVLACAVFLAGLTIFPAVHDLVWDRIQTFSDPSHDVSFEARLQGYKNAVLEIAQEPFGEGLGSMDAEHSTEGNDDAIGPHDSTPLEFLYSLGWVGSMMYALGFSALVYQIWRKGARERFTVTANAIVLGFAAQCLLNSVMLGVLGFIVWTFASLSLCEVQAFEPTAAIQVRRTRATNDLAAA
jgi:O-Antigen ligase